MLGLYIMLDTSKSDRVQILVLYIVYDIPKFDLLISLTTWTNSIWTLNILMNVAQGLVPDTDSPWIRDNSVVII